MSELLRLQKEVDELRAENKILREQVEFLGQHRTVARGMAGERLMASLTSGQLTSYADASDLVLANGVTIEVKTGTLTTPKPGGLTRRWMWNKVFGQSGSKRFDFLLLVGVSDERWRNQYRDRSSPYILFLLPFAAVDRFTVAMNGRGIALTTNPSRTSSKYEEIWSFQITAEELGQRFLIDP